MWDVDYSLIEKWLEGQGTDIVASVFAALELLSAKGPNLGRPLVDTLKGSRYANLKELRPASPGSSEIRIIFAFDPRRSAIMLLAGDKAAPDKGRHRWSGWYKVAIPRAEKLYAEHLRHLGGIDA